MQIVSVTYSFLQIFKLKKTDYKQNKDVKENEKNDALGWLNCKREVKEEEVACKDKLPL